MNKRIETKVSITAQGTCLTRALSYYEKDSHYKSDDYIAPMLVPSYLNVAAKMGFFRRMLKKSLFKTPGNYEYLIARTKFIDTVFRNLDSNIEQVLIFGAGFDSRAIRFRNELEKAKVFELDASMTQQTKITSIKKQNIQFPANLNFISIDFNKESLSQKLDEAGFVKNKTCLFLLEGLTMYLDQESINNTFNLVNEYSGKNSVVVFDYVVASLARQEQRYGDPQIKKHYEFLAKVGEKPSFAIDEHMSDFLAKYKLELVDELDSSRLAKEYFIKEDFGRIAQKFRIVTAIKRV